MTMPGSLKRSSLTALAALLLSNPIGICATNVSLPDPRTEQAAILCQKGSLPEAAELEKTVLSQNPGQWLPHAMMSYLRWQQGNVIEAVSEGQTAARLAPDNASVLTNLGLVGITIGDYETAIAPLEQAKSVAPPNDWIPRLGLFRCYYMSRRTDEALRLLHEMASQDEKSFDWYYQTADACLMAGQNALAVECAQKATRAASTSEQKSASEIQLLLTLLNDNKLARAKVIKNAVFENDKPKDSELYVRAASALIPATDPAAGKELLQSALDNLKAKEDGDAFFRLGTIFEDKAGHVSNDATKFGAWISGAGIAYSRAISLAPDQPSYHLALAGNWFHKGETDRMSEELTKVEILLPVDPFASFLKTRIKADQNDLAGNVRTKPTSTEPPIALHLTKVHFKLNGIGCSCKISRVLMALSKVNGVAFASIPLMAPYQGDILVDESVTPIDDVFSQCTANTFAANPATDKVNSPARPLFGFEFVSRQPIASMPAAIEVAQSVEHPDILRFRRQFKTVVPIMPVNLARPGDAHLIGDKGSAQ